MNHLNTKHGLFHLLMKLKDYSILLVVLLILQTITGQQQLKGTVRNSANKKPIANAEVYHPQIGTQVVTAPDGSFVFEDVPTGTFQLTVFATDFEILE